MDAMTFAAFHLNAQRAAEQQRELAIRAGQAARRAVRAEAPSTMTTPDCGPAAVLVQGELALAGPSS